MLISGAAFGAEPCTLERALERALAHNPDTQLARYRITAAQAGVDQANAAFWPRVQLQASYTRTDNPMMVFGSILNQRAYSSSLNFNDVPNVDNLNTRGVVTMPLYTGGRNKAAREAGKANTEAARQDDAAVRNALSFEVARSFNTVLKTREFIRAAEAAVSSFQTDICHRQQTTRRRTLLGTDLLDLKVRLAQAREDLVHANNANALANRALKNLLGIEGGDLEIVDGAPSAVAPDSGDFSGRAELAAVRHRERAAEEQVRGANAGYLPRISVFGSWAMIMARSSKAVAAAPRAGCSMGYLGRKLTRAKAREARANLESAREEQRKVQLALGLEVEQARLELKAATERLTVTQQAVSLALESASLTQARFQQGAALSTQLMDAETALVSARVRRAEAEADQRIALAALRKAVSLPQLESKSKVVK